MQPEPALRPDLGFSLPVTVTRPGEMAVECVFCDEGGQPRRRRLMSLTALLRPLPRPRHDGPTAA